MKLTVAIDLLRKGYGDGLVAGMREIGVFEVRTAVMVGGKQDDVEGRRLLLDLRCMVGFAVSRAVCAGLEGLDWEDAGGG